MFQAGMSKPQEIWEWSDKQNFMMPGGKPAKLVKTPWTAEMEKLVENGDACIILAQSGVFRHRKLTPFMERQFALDEAEMARACGI